MAEQEELGNQLCKRGEGQGRVQMAPKVLAQALVYRGTFTETGKAEDGKAFKQKTDIIEAMP